MSPFDTGWLAAAIALAAPLLVAALGELVLERAGVINIGVEGLLAAGAFTGFAVAWATESVLLGVLVAMLAGIALATVMAVGVLVFGGDQIVLGFGILILALGGTAFLNDVIFSDQGRVSVPAASVLEVPLLSSIPFAGAMFRQTAFVYLAYLAVPVIAVLLSRTQVGLRLRATGESPPAVQAAGHSPRNVRALAFVIAGCLGGLAGAMLSVGAVGVFNEGMTGGRGFLALAAVAFAAWRPWWLLGACLFFGAVDALQLRLQALGHVPPTVWAVLMVLLVALAVWRLRMRARRAKLGASTSSMQVPWLTGILAVVSLILWVARPDVSIPAQFYLMLPYVAAIAVLAGLAGRRQAPADLGEPLPARA